MLFYSPFRWVRLFFSRFFIKSLFHLCKLLSKLGWEMEAIWAEPQTCFGSALVEVVWSCFSWSTLVSALFNYFSSGKSGKAATGDVSPAETRGAVVYLLLRLNLLFILLKSQDVMMGKEHASLSIWLKNESNKILGNTRVLVYLISFHICDFVVSLICAVGFPGFVLLFDWSLGMQEQEERGDLKWLWAFCSYSSIAGLFASLFHKATAPLTSASDCFVRSFSFCKSLSLHRRGWSCCCMFWGCAGPSF